MVFEIHGFRLIKFCLDLGPNPNPFLLTYPNKEFGFRPLQIQIQINDIQTDHKSFFRFWANFCAWLLNFASKYINIYVKTFFSCSKKLRDKLRINFTIVKLITIILMYVPWLKKISFIFLSSHTQINFLNSDNHLSFLFSLRGTHLFLSVCGPFFFFLFVFCSSAHHTHAFYIFNSAASNF